MADDCVLVLADDCSSRGRNVVKRLGNGLGRAGKGVWRAVRRTTRLRRSPSLLSLPGPDGPEGSSSAAASPFWSMDVAFLKPAASMQLPSLLPSWVLAPMQQLLGLEVDTSSSTAPFQPHSAPTTVLSSKAEGTRSSRRRTRKERREARQLRRESKRQQKQARKAGLSSSSSTTTTSNSAGMRASTCTAGASSMHASTCPSGGFSMHVLAHMINPANTFPMLLHSAEHILQQHMQHTAGTHKHKQLLPPQQSHSMQAEQGTGPAQQEEHQLVQAGAIKPPQQLLTVGSRHWGNWWDGRGLLRVKIYDFAIYVDGHQVQSQLLVTQLQLAASSQQQEQHLVHHGHLPAVLKASDTPVDMSLVLKAARDVPLQLLSAEYEKVLMRRLDRVGGSQGDVSALRQLLASFSSADRLPAAVTAGAATAAVDGAGTSDGSSGSRDLTELADGSNAGNSGGSVRKGAMIVFERNTQGNVTARVGPVTLATVTSPKVAEALFDLYLGDQPVSKSAKDAAAQTLQRMAATAGPASSSTTQQQQQQQRQQQGGTQPQDPSVSAAAAAAYYLPNSRGQQIRCEGGAASGSRSGLKQLRATGEGPALKMEELDACVLHMG